MLGFSIAPGGVQHPLTADVVLMHPPLPDDLDALLRRDGWQLLARHLTTKHVLAVLDRIGARTPMADLRMLARIVGASELQDKADWIKAIENASGVSGLRRFLASSRIREEAIVSEDSRSERSGR